MGDLQVGSPQLNGVVYGEDRLCLSPPSPPLPPSNPDPSLVAVEAWQRAEKTTHEILCRIQPTLGADQRRREVVDYVQRLIKYWVGCEVFPYGSVPLKTYLPDGDIDLTALGCQNIEDALVSEVHAVLRGQESNEAAEYEVKDVRFIDAEVKLVKCIVQNIVVDISFNQLGGLCTLCFLEQVDRRVGKAHLFKRSIILIKAWCYYESRILGAHHGLISTYALETLVLYIFHQFHSSLDGPLVVLYRFLDYFSKFDWENYCVSLKGPVCKSSLPDIVAEVPENGGNNPLLTEEFIRNCVELFSVPSRGLESNLRAFPQKHLNIIDPLKENNNLGRSVNRGNFYRIRSAFKYGARKLGWILMLPEDRIADELDKFFANTLDRHGITQWVDLQNPSLDGIARGSNSSSSSLDTKISESRNDTERYFVKDVSSQAGPLYDSTRDKVAVLAYHAADSKTAGVLGITNTNGSSYSSDMRSHYNASMSKNPNYPAHSNLHMLRENRKAEFRGTAINSILDDEKEKHAMVNNSHVNERDMASYGRSGLLDTSKSLLDLSGDYDSHIRSLQYGQICNGYAISPPIMPSPPRSPKLPNRNHWETDRQFLQMNHNIHPQPSTNGVVGQIYLPTLPIVSFGPEEKRKPRGTGAYFPNMTSRPYRDKLVPGRGRSQASGTNGQLLKHTRNNGLAAAPSDVNLSVEGSFETGPEVFTVPGSAKPRSSETSLSQNPVRVSHHANSFPQSSEKHESGCISPQLHGSSRTEVSSQQESGISVSRGSVPSTGVLAEESSNSSSGTNHKRIELEAYRLKNEDDFPPLSH